MRVAVVSKSMLCLRRSVVKTEKNQEIIRERPECPQCGSTDPRYIGSGCYVTMQTFHLGHFSWPESNLRDESSSRTSLE